MSSSEQATNHIPDSDLATGTGESSHSVQTHIIEHLELLAEKAEIEIEKQSIGRLLVKKVVREQTIQIPAVLTEEILVIEYKEHTEAGYTFHHADHMASIQLNGKTITLINNQIIEIPIYREEAVIHKKVVLTEQVDIGKLTRQYTVNHSVILQHEELEIEEQPSQNSALERQPNPKN